MKMERTDPKPPYPPTAECKSMIVNYLRSFHFLLVPSIPYSIGGFTGDSPCKLMVFTALQKKILPAAY